MQNFLILISESISRYLKFALIESTGLKFSKREVRPIFKTVSQHHKTGCWRANVISALLSCFGILGAPPIQSARSHPAISGRDGEWRCHQHARNNHRRGSEIETDRE
jgi:hypothetical protein